MPARKIRIGKVTNKEGLRVTDSLDVDHSPVIADISYGVPVRYTTTSDRKVVRVEVTNKVYGYAKKADVR